MFEGFDRSFFFFLVDLIEETYISSDMSERRDESERRKPGKVQVPLALPVELAEQIDEASVAVKLSKQDTMRLALERGLPVLLAQLTGPVAA